MRRATGASQPTGQVRRATAEEAIQGLRRHNLRVHETNEPIECDCLVSLSRRERERQGPRYGEPQNRHDAP